METEKIIILTEAGTEYGFGHLTRCLAIAQGFKENKVESKFYVRGSFTKEFKIEGFKCSIGNWLNEEVDIDDKIVVVDSYYANQEFCTKIYRSAKRVLFIDDYNRIKYPGGFVLNSVIGAESIDYPKNKCITYLFGPDYHPIRKDFWEVSKKIINNKILKILITFGGSDIANKTPEILKFLTEKYPEISKIVIIGSGFSNIDEIKKISDKNTKLVYYPEALQMKMEMLECDLAISAAGQTLYELARIGVPTYAVQVIENQTNNILNWRKNNFLLPGNIFIDLPDFNLRKTVSENGVKIVDGKGVHRIYERLMNDKS